MDDVDYRLLFVGCLFLIRSRYYTKLTQIIAMCFKVSPEFSILLLHLFVIHVWNLNVVAIMFKFMSSLYMDNPTYEEQCEQSAKKSNTCTNDKHISLCLDLITGSFNECVEDWLEDLCADSSTGLADSSR